MRSLRCAARSPRSMPVQLVAMGVLVPGFGSLVLGLAVVQRHIPATEAHRLAILDETFQEEIPGPRRRGRDPPPAHRRGCRRIARLLELSA